MRSGRFKLSVEADDPKTAFERVQDAVKLTDYRVVPVDPAGFEASMSAGLDDLKAKPDTPEDHIKRFNNVLSVFKYSGKGGQDIADGMLAIGALADGPWAAVIEVSPRNYVVFGFAL